ncbi:MAG: ead/Ea22-like family protein [Klebsiella pneumoniae]|nr:ead/Ea22-like family protein [Klebsiella pneumoniae]MDU1775534.1 ead/Ea22-like family protein [Klebsiella pneumoniae]
MTDITELAQSLKAAAEKATPGQWGRGDGKHGGELLVYCDDALGSAVCEATSEYNAIPKYQRIDNLDFIALANPANILALVEALEKAQKQISRLESRSVKLPKAMSIDGGAYCSAHAHYDSDGDYYDRADVEEMLSVAGIKVETE